jgi:translation initiation factor 2-alpha kinase 4
MSNKVLTRFYIFSLLFPCLLHVVLMSPFDTSIRAAIFLEDFKVTSESPHTRFTICVRPYSDGMGFGDLNVSAILDVICFAGYPHKCPKLRIIPEKSLSKEDADRLLSLLVEQANIYSREGRVMIFDLVEAAQEFLSEIAPANDPASTAPHLVSNTIHQTTDADAKVSLDSGSDPGISYIFNSFDLFSQLYDDNSWQRQSFDPITDSAKKTIESPVQLNVRSKRKPVDEKSRFSADKINAAKSSSRDNAEQHAIKHGNIRDAVPSLHVVAEETDNDSKTLSTSNGGGMSDTPDRSSSSVHEPEDSDLEDEAWNNEGSDSGSSNAPSYVSDTLDDAARNKKRDLILVLFFI